MEREVQSIEFDELFKISLTALKISLSHPNYPRNKMWGLKLLALHINNFFISCVYMYNAYLEIKLENYPDACRNMLMGFIFHLVNYQYLTIVVNTGAITSLMEMTKADYAKFMSSEERDLVLLYAKMGRNVCVQWLIVGISSACVFIVKHLYMELYTYATSGWRLLPLIPLTYPSPIEEHKENPLVYTIIYFALIYYVACNGTIMVAGSPLGLLFMLHACGQLELVRRRILALYVNKSTEEIEVKLKDIVKRLHYIYSFIDYIQDAFRLFYDITMKCTAIVMSIAAYEVLVSYNRGEFSIEFIIFIATAILFSSYPCYYSDMLMDKGEEIRQALYSCGWETRYDHGVRKTLLVMLTRSLQPTVIQTLFRTVCLDALTDVFQEAYAIFNLINAFS